MTTSSLTSPASAHPPISAVIAELLDTQDGHALGVLTLNDPKALNALSVEMCQLISQHLANWQDNEKVVAIVLKGSGDKAFCAGGNIRKLYDSMGNDTPLPNPYAEAFFGAEYRLYRQMRFYAKPIVLWANGIVMGGGMGLMGMASHRVVTETTRFAMPEITIGLYPDATGSWALQRMPADTGLFLGLTGAQCNGKDALLANMAEFAVASDDYYKVISALQNADWQADKRHHEIASQALSVIHTLGELPDSNLAKHWQIIQTLMNKGDIHAIDVALQDDDLLQTYADDRWFSKALATYKAGCPVTAALTHRIYQMADRLSLEQILYMEYNVSLQCANNPDFREGVRALLVDKDRSPQWSRTLAECDPAYIDAHFDSAYPKGDHPFADWLGQASLGAKQVRHSK